MVKRRKKKNTTVYRVKRGAANAISNFFSAFSIFFTLLLLTGFFILFQWKNVKFRSHLAEIDKLTEEILILNTENTRLETIRNELLKSVPHKAEKKLGLISPIELGQKLIVDKKQLLVYEEKDRKVQ